jgi:hypothetical protein
MVNLEEKYPLHTTIFLNGQNPTKLDVKITTQNIDFKAKQEKSTSRVGLFFQIHQ